MSSTRKRILVPAAIVVSLTLSPMLTACSNPLQGLVEQATGGQLDLGGTQVPADFPADVPLAQGSVIFGAGVGSEDGKVWSVTIKVADANALDGITQQLISAGFESQTQGEATGETKSGIFAKEPYGVLVVVAKDDANGFIANYTVTYAKPGS